MHVALALSLRTEQSGSRFVANAEHFGVWPALPKAEQELSCPPALPPPPAPGAPPPPNTEQKPASKAEHCALPGLFGSSIELQCVSLPACTEHWFDELPEVALH